MQTAAPRHGPSKFGPSSSPSPFSLRRSLHIPVRPITFVLLVSSSCQFLQASFPNPNHPKPRLVLSFLSCSAVHPRNAPRNPASRAASVFVRFPNPKAFDPVISRGSSTTKETRALSHPILFSWEQESGKRLPILGGREMGRRMRHAIAALCAACVVVAVAADRGFSPASAGLVAPEEEISLLNRIADFMWGSDGNSYHHVWPEMEFGWKMVLGSLIGFFGASFGSVGGVGGGGIFVPMLTLIIGFDAKSSTAMSKCMITGAAVSTVYYNLKLKHPTLDMPMIDYDLALLIQPMLMLGISIGVIFNVIFPDWLVTVLLIILFLGTSTKAFLKGVETWKKETIVQREVAKRSEQISEEREYAPLPTGPGAAADGKVRSDEAPSLMNNIYWKEFGLLTFVWLAFLAIQITKNYTSTCSTWYWVLNFLQIPVSVGVTMYEALGLMNGKRVLSSKGTEQTTLKFHQLCIYCFFGVTAGLVGGLLGLGGGFIMGPLFLELGIPPQVSSATATFAMMFSASMSVVEYYLLNRFPVPYAAYFVAVAFVAAIIGQHVVRRLISWLGRASLIIFILAFMIFVSAISLGGVGISNMIQKIQRHEYMGFENLCKYDA